MTTIQTNNRTWCFVGVPDAIDYFYHPKNNILECLIAYGGYDRSLGEEVGNDIVDIPLPPGTWSIFADTQTISEDEAEQLVDSYTLDSGYDESDINGYYFNYANPTASNYEVSPDTTFEGDPLKSFASLIRSLNLHGRQIILELLNNEQ